MLLSTQSYLYLKVLCVYHAYKLQIDSLWSETDKLNNSKTKISVKKPTPFFDFFADRKVDPHPPFADMSVTCECFYPSRINIWNVKRVKEDDVTRPGGRRVILFSIFFRIRIRESGFLNTDPDPDPDDPKKGRIRILLRYVLDV